MSDGNSIVNLGDLTKPATVLIEKVSNAVGVLYEPKRIRNNAAAEIEVEKMKALAGLELSEIQQRGIERFVGQEARKQENIEKITSTAAEALTSDANTDELDEDWIAHFFDKCDKVSNEQMQALWSRLLAGEATKPGTYSKRTIDFIATMDKSDADLFANLCQFVWVIGGATPLIFDENLDIYDRHGINFSSLNHLDSIGLISFAPTGYRKSGFGKKAAIYYQKLITVLEFAKDSGNEVKVGKVLFTQAGKELASICGVQKNQEYYEHATEKLSEQNIILSTRL